ncbi:MAG: hypothetical protein ACLRFJ_00840 [Alphaproteobacteria bacterium]
MKTKIIYVSGGNKFNIADVRAAFEEVRQSLSFDDDTVLFGVPVDCDDDLGGQFESVQQIDEKSDTDTVVDEAPALEPTPDVPVEKKRGRKKTVIEPIQEEADEKIIPILSILGGDNEDEKHTEPEPDNPTTDDTNIVITTETTVISEPDDVVDSVVESVEVDQIITTDAPAETSEPIEKTLKELLESMAPLTEDEKENDAEPELTDSDVPYDDSAEDATLQQLATEFIESQDKINSATKSTSRSKIGKLKNILPFKKAKHDEGGIMGDLFGWAGVAANDEEFAMPGFLDLSSKK